MSKQQTPDPTDSNDDRLTIERDGLTVEKAIGHHRDDVVKVTFTARSTREEPVRLRLVDQLPEEIEADSVGFHPDYDPQGWSVGDDRTVIYEAVIEPGGERETMYGARVSSTDEFERFADRPEVELSAVREPDDQADDSPFGPAANDVEDDTSPAEADPAAPDAADASGDEEPTGANVDDDADSEALSLDDGTDGTVGDDGDEADSTTAGSGPVEFDEGDDDNGIVDALIGELQTDGLSEADRSTIREALGLDESASDQVRLDHVQTTVDDLVAYRDALEGFIDENGPAEAVVDEFRTSLADQAADISALRESVEELRDRLESLEADHEADTDELSDRLEQVEGELSDTHAALEAELDGVREDLSRLREWREKLSVAAQLADTGVESDATAD